MGARNDYTIKTVQDVFGGYGGGGSTSGSSDEFYMDTGAVANVIDDLSKASGDYGAKIEELTEIVTNLKNSWSGETYDDFAQYYKEYLERLTKVKSVLENFSQILNNKVGKTNQVASRVSQILEGGN